jgi:type II secretory pathway predicted ATPase ExeA
MNNEKKISALFGLKWNPFLPNIPVDALWHPPGMESFLFRLENMVMDGGFALIHGEPGLGKSKTLQLIAHRCKQMSELRVGVMERPQSSVSDFYREMGELFGVNLTPANRYGGFKALRERWREHIAKTLFRPVLLIDEAQEMTNALLNELRLLGSADFDSQCLLTIVLCGDTRLPERFRSEDLVALGSRIRLRMYLEPYGKQTLNEYVTFSMEQAGAAHLMTPELVDTLVSHCAGNPRILNSMAGELLDLGARKELSRLDEKLFLEVYSVTSRKGRRK